MSYDVYMALHEETNSGWVWFKSPDLPSRSLVRIRNSGRTVECECRILDDRDVVYYNAETHGTRKIDPNAYQNVVILSDWYREALNVVKAATMADLDIQPLQDCFWYALRAGCQHPDPMVRLATRLGVLGAWLGIGGLLFALAPPLSEKLCLALTNANLIASVLVIILGIAAWSVCRGIKR